MRAPSPVRGSGRLAEARELARNLRTPDSGLLGQGVRFLIAGSIVALVYLTSTTVLASVVGLPFQLALAIGFSLAIVVHFTLQRLFVWVHHEEFALPFHHQAGRYLLVAGAQYGITAASTYVLPRALGVPTELVYLATAVVLLIVNFLVFRNRVFHPQRPVEDAPLISVVNRD
jgi:putative flippase GtrA